MPFKTKYNEDIAKRVHRINKDFVDEFQHEGNDSSNFLNLGIPADTKGYAPYKNYVASGSSGGSIYSRAKKIYDTGKYLYDEAGKLYKKPLSRGLHHASRIADHYGYGHPDHLEGGLSWGDTFKGMAGMTLGLGKKGNGSSGGRLPISDIGHSLSNLAGAFGLGKKRKSKKQKMEDGEVSSSEEEEEDKKKKRGGGPISTVGHSLSHLAGAFGLGKKRKSKKQKMEEMAGGGPISTVGHSLSHLAGAFGLGKKKKKQAEEMAGGGPISGIGHSLSNLAGAFGLGKKSRKGKGAGVFKPEFEAGPMRGGVHISKDRAVDRNTINGNIGGGKKPNKRAEIVKQVMKKNGCSMIEASKYVKQHNLY